MNALDVVAPTRAPARAATTDPASADETAAENGTFLAMLSAAMQQAKPATPPPSNGLVPSLGELLATAGDGEGETDGDTTDGQAVVVNAGDVAPAPVMIDAAPDAAIDDLVRAAVAANLPPKPPVVKAPTTARRPSAVVQIAKPANAEKLATPAAAPAKAEVTPESVALTGLLQHEEIADSLEAIAADNAVRDDDQDDDTKTPESPAAALSALLHAAVEAQADATRKDAARPVSETTETPVSEQAMPIDPALTLTDPSARDERGATPAAPALAKALPKLLDALGFAPRAAETFAMPRDVIPVEPAVVDATPSKAGTAAVVDAPAVIAPGIDASTLAIDGVLAVQVETVAADAAPTMDAEAPVVPDATESTPATGSRQHAREAAPVPAAPRDEQGATNERRDRDERAGGGDPPLHRDHGAANAPAASSWSTHAAVARGETVSRHVDAPAVHAPATVRTPDEPMRGAGPTSHVTVQLDGDTLGANRVRVAVRGDSVRATVFADEGKASSLAAHLPELRRALEEHGFADARVTIQAEAAVDRSSPIAAAAVSDDLRLRTAGASRSERGGNEQTPRGQRQHADPQREQQRRREAAQEEAT